MTTHTAARPEKESKKSTGIKGGKRPGAGRPKGSLDKGNALIRELIVDALHELGGVDYLKGVAKSHPAAFMSLVGKAMPAQIDAAVAHSGGITVNIQQF